MIAEDRDGVRLYRFETLPADRVDAFASTRRGGHSAGRYASLNLGLRVDDDGATVIRNRRTLFEAAGLALERSVWCRQVHSDRVTVIGTDEGRGYESDDDEIPGTDALVTDVPGVSLTVTVGDCVPVAIYDPRHHAAGLVHAGWGGTVARICSRTVEALKARYGSDPADLLAAIGPSIGPDDYEVGQDVIERARAAYATNAGRFLRATTEHKATFDLWEANALDLESAGVPRNQIEIAGISTATRLDDFYSHRVEGWPTGRFAAVLTLR